MGCLLIGQPAEGEKADFPDRKAIGTEAATGPASIDNQEPGVASTRCRGFSAGNEIGSYVRPSSESGVQQLQEEVMSSAAAHAVFPSRNRNAVAADAPLSAS